MKDNAVMERYVMQVGAEVEKVVGYKWPSTVQEQNSEVIGG